VQLLDPGAGHGVLLLERLRPDLSVRSLPEAKALLEAAATLRRLWVEPPGAHVFETVAGRTQRQAGLMRSGSADGETGALVDAALAVREELLADAPEERLLHGCRGWRWGRTRWWVSVRSTWPGWCATGWRI
jgi:streptomycin 6-kinase